MKVSDEARWRYLTVSATGHGIGKKLVEADPEFPSAFIKVAVN